MAPDLNSLPNTASPTVHANSGGTGGSNSHSPHASPRQRSPTLHHRSSPRLHLQRRTSSRLGSFSLNDSTSSSPVTADAAYHHRQPSLGELHQELEEEQEGHVNRLLSLIRRQQATISAYEAASGTTPDLSHASGPGPDEQSPLAAPAASASHAPFPAFGAPAASPSRPSAASLSRASSHRSRTSHASSPSIGGGGPGPAGAAERGRHGTRHGDHQSSERDDLATAQAEAQMAMRENQMLKGRIRELERQIAESRRDHGPGPGQGDPQAN